MIFFSFFLSVCITVSLWSCDGEYEYAYQNVVFNFVDSQNNNLLDETTVEDLADTEMYIFNNEKDIPEYKNLKFKEHYKMDVGVGEYEGINILGIFCTESFPGYDKQYIILRFPKLFKDNEFHKIVTYWNTSKKHNKENLYPKCSHVEIDGKEAEIINHTENYVKIVLDK